jgi:hypothetical protein
MVQAWSSQVATVLLALPRLAEVRVLEMAAH